MKRKDLYNYIREEIINELTTVTKSTETSEIPDIAKAEKTTTTTVANAMKTAKSTGKDVNIAEMARKAGAYKIGDNSKFNEAKELYNVGIYSDVLKAIEEAGEDGLTQKDLGSKLGKGDGSSLNSILNKFKAIGVLGGGKLAATEKPSKIAPEIEPETDDEEDDFFKVDDEDTTPEEKPEVASDKELEKTIGTTPIAPKLDSEEQKLVDTYKKAITNKAKTLNDKKASSDDKAKAKAALNSYSTKPDVKKAFTKAGINIVDYIDSELNK